MGLWEAKQALELQIKNRPTATLDSLVDSVVETHPWMPKTHDTDELRLQLATTHEAIGSALALLRQGQTDAAMLVLDDALKGRTR